MPNPVNPRAIVPQFQVSMSHRRILNVAATNPDWGSQQLPIGIDSGILQFKKCYLNISANIITSSAGFQNIAATSTFTMSCSVKYCLVSGTGINELVPDIPVATLRTSITVIPNNGNHAVQFNNINLLGLTFNSAAGQNFERQLLQPGYFFFGFFYEPAQPKSLGAGVTDATIFALKADVNFTLVCVPTYIT